MSKFLLSNLFEMNADKVRYTSNRKNDTFAFGSRPSLQYSISNTTSTTVSGLHKLCLVLTMIDYTFDTQGMRHYTCRVELADFIPGVGISALLRRRINRLTLPISIHW